MDLLGDGANTYAEENSLPEQEAHVAFSVEGLFLLISLVLFLFISNTPGDVAWIVVYVK